MNAGAVLVALVLLTFIGCVGFDQATEPEPPPDVENCARVFKVRAGFSLEQRDSLARAAARWNEIAIESFCVQDDETEGGPEVRPIEYGGEEYQRLYAYFRSDFGGAHWIDAQGKDVIVLRTDVDVLGFEAVAMHEFGHAHRLGHIPDPGIMSDAEFTWDFTEYDLAECRRVGACE